MTSERKKPGLAFWAAVMALVAVLYVASFGPAVWLVGHRQYRHFVGSKL